MRQLKNYVVRHAKGIVYFAKSRHLPAHFLHKHVPYFSQWESPNLNKQILKKSISTDDDPNWQASGAKTKQEYHDWSWSGCGMACTKMLAAHLTGQIMPLVKLGKKCAEYGGYTMPLKESVGLLYRPYAQFINREFGWRGRVAVGMPIQEIMYELSRGNYVIASVSPKIRHPQDTPTSKGGHLVLLLGYDMPKRTMYLHNPSGDSKESQAYAEVSFDDFKKFFSGRGIVVRASGAK